jgi:hypothetical protein
MLAVATDHPNDVIIGTLLAKRPAINVKSNVNETALAWSAKFKYPSIMAAISEASPGIAAPELISVSRQRANSNNPQDASEKGIDLLQKTSGTFFKQSGCVVGPAQLWH